MEDIVKIILLIIGMIISVVIVVVVIITFIKFANTTVNELPTWAWWLLH